ncbi:MAG: glycosyltransferase family 9 protein [Planctomycetes bacterium]|nr:glycosyltransferase family 9 protein [Planctomycetota bacterium]
MSAPAPTFAIVRLSALGDLLHTLPAAFDLRTARPEARLLWIAQREWAPLLASLPWLDEVIPFDRRGGWRAWRAMRQQLGTRALDVSLDFQGNWKSAAAALASGARRRFGLARADRREPGLGWLYHRVATQSPAPHALDRARHALASWFDLTPASAPPDWERVLPSSAIDRAEAERLIQTLELDGAPPLVLLLPTQRPDPRAWPAAAWAELARELARCGLAPLFITGPAESSLGAALERELGAGTERGARIRHLVGQRGVLVAIALFRSLRGRALTAIASDSGALHLAVVGGLRAIALAGPQDPRRTGPHGVGHRVATAARELPCRPCLARRCRLASGPVCLDELSAREVLEAVLQLAAERSG